MISGFMLTTISVFHTNDQVTMESFFRALSFDVT